MTHTVNRTGSAFTNFSWNAIGSAANTITSLILLMIVTQILGVKVAGPFAIAFTTAQILLAVGLYGIRNYQVTDVQHIYSEGIYISSRMVTSISMLGIGLLFCVLSQYDFEKTALVCVLLACRIAESISDVYYGILQKRGKLYMAGISMSVRSILSILVFYFSLLAFQNLLLSCLLLTIAGYIPIVLIDLPFSGKQDAIAPSFDWKKMMELLRICFPIFAASILPIIVINLPKYVIDRTMLEEYQTIYNIIVMPGTAIVLFSQIVTQSLLVRLAHDRSLDQMRSFFGVILKIILGVILFTGGIIVLFYLYGRELLQLLYGIDLAAYIPQLLIVLVGAMFCSIAIIISVALTTLRITRIQLYLFVINLITALGISIYLIPRYGLKGAADSYLLIMLVQLILYTVVFLLTIIKTKKLRKLRSGIEDDGQ